MPRFLRHVCILLTALPLFACQVISASITSPSDWVSGTGESISGSFDSLSTSSGSGGKSEDASKTAYRRDLRAYSAQFAETGGSSADFLRGIGRVAESHGITHWEGDPSTLQAIGAGLRDAGVSPADMDALAARSTQADPEVVALVLEGYAATR